MEEKKSVKISLSTFFLLLAILVIIAMSYYIYAEKTNSNKIIADLEANTVNMQDKIDDLQGKLDSISNTINSNTTSNTENTTSTSINNNTTNNSSVNNTTSNENNSTKYVFTSADKAAAQGYPKTLKIFELNDFEMKFSYNSAFDFSTSTIDRTVTGTARANAEQIYEFEEIIDGHQYQLMFEFDQNKETVKVIELDNGDELGFINLYR